MRAVLRRVPVRNETGSRSVTPDRQRSIARVVAVGAAVVVAACIAILVADYTAARLRTVSDAARVAQLQAQARTDGSAARAVEAEHNRITQDRRARRSRSDALAILLIAASGALIGSIKWRMAVGPRRPVVAPLKLIKHAKENISPLSPLPASLFGAASLDLSFVDRIIDTHGTSTEAAIPILQAIQSHYRYLPDEALRRVVERTVITPAQLEGTSSFYARFRRSPVGEHVIRVCHGTACHVSGARQITEELRRQLSIPDGADTDPNRRFTIDEVACLGCCSLAPVLTIDDHTAGRLTPATAAAEIDLFRFKAQPA